jgi:hypothetical protein
MIIYLNLPDKYIAMFCNVHGRSIYLKWGGRAFLGSGGVCFPSASIFRFANTLNLDCVHSHYINYSVT